MIEITVTWLDGTRKGAVEAFTSLPLRLGRADECQVRFGDKDSMVSASHCEVRSDGEGALEVEDLGSKNGTLVNGAAIEGAMALPNHGVLQLGKDGPRVKVAFAETRDAPSGISFGSMRKQAEQKAANPRKMATTDETPIYKESDLGPGDPTPTSTLVVAVVLGILALAAIAFAVLK